MALSALSAHAGDSIAVMQRTLIAEQQQRELFAQSYDNPVVRQWMLPVSYSTLALSYTHDRQSQAVTPELGDGSSVAAFDADAYIKHGTSTLWGKAYYNNGKQYNIEGNETSDFDVIYPYVTYDEIGGDMRLERYYFGGGFADTRGRWSWGGALSYLAGLYYRNVDPRPRNVTGTLDASLGAAYRAWRDYSVALSVNARKYKQSNDIEFVSEMGSSPIYHATGLGTNYVRFAGTGEAAYYNGYRYGATANIYPASGSGLIASAGVSRFTFKKILTDLNRLPLCSVWHNALNMQVGYSHTAGRHTVAAAFNYDFYRRHGRENIFGDAATSIYPQIGYLEMYADNYYALSVSGLYEYRAPRLQLSVMPAVGYSHDRQVYADPRIDLLVNTVTAACAVKADCPVSDKWMVSARAKFDGRFADAGDVLRFNAAASVLRTITEKYALSLGVDYTRAEYKDSVHQNTINTSIKFIF
jgi:hypothetical protein